MHRKITFLWLSVVLLAGGISAAEDVWQPYEAIRRDGSTLDTLKHRIIVSESGLPEQLLTKPHDANLPLEMRGEEIRLDNTALVALGRGRVLRAPMRLEAYAGGNRITAGVTQPASVAAESDAAVSYASGLEAGPFDIKLETRYTCDGAIHCKIAWSAQQPVESLALVIDVEGALTHAYRGLPADFRPDAFAREQLDIRLSDENDAVVWSSLDEWAGKCEPFVDYLYFGSLDRGFTWLCGERAGFAVDGESPMLVITRDAAGNATARIFFVSKQLERSEGEVSFVLAVHPSKPRPSGFRNVQWLDWQQNGELTPASPAQLRQRLVESAAKGELAEITGFKASAFESAARQLELRGFAGADSISPHQDNVRLYPASLFAVLAAPHLGLPARIRTNTAYIVPAGTSRSYDRQILGRALTYDIGAAIEGFRQPAQLLGTVTILDEFGLFDDDETEVIPYWRNSHILRFGEVWNADDAFELEQDDPAAHVYVTVYRRRYERDGRNGYKALIVVLNESDTAVSQRLHILDSDKLFGGLNAHNPREVLEDLPFHIIPEQGDWRIDKVYSDHTGRSFGRSAGHHTDDLARSGVRLAVLRDMEDTGYVTRFPMRDAPPPDMYGPLFVRPRDIRIIYGYSLEE